MEGPRRALASEGPLGNALPQSSIPVPQSAIKKPVTRIPSSSRTSMMPPPSQGFNARASTLTSGSGLDGGPRRTTIAPRAMDAAGQAVMSGNRGDGGYLGRTPNSGRTLNPSSVRRSSVFPAGGSRQSILPSNNAFSTSQQREIRPITNPQWKADTREIIAKYLTASHCPIQLIGKTLISPTQVNFQAIFRYIVVDLLKIEMAPQPLKKFEDEALLVLKDLKYPLIENIGKTSLCTAGNERNWSTLLPMLLWLVDLCKANDHLNNGVVEEDLEDDAQYEDRLFAEYIKKCYAVWYEGLEDYSEPEQDLKEAYHKMAQSVYEENERLETEVQKQDVERQQLQALEPPLKQLGEIYMQLMGDKTKFIAFIETLGLKLEKLVATNMKAKAAVNDTEDQILAMRNELAKTEAAVAAQNLSPDEVNRMNHEREALTRNLDELRAKITEASQASYDQELQVTRSMDRFDQLLQDYNSLGSQIGTIPLDRSLGPGNVNYVLELELGIEDTSEIQAVGTRMKREIRPALMAYREGFRSEARELEDRIIAREDEADQLSQKVERQKEDVGTLEWRLKAVLQNAEEARAQLATETEQTNATVTIWEKRVAAMDLDGQTAISTLKTKLEETQVEYSELQHSTHTLKETLSAEIQDHIRVIMAAKEHTVNALKELRAFAETHQ